MEPSTPAYDPLKVPVSRASAGKMCIRDRGKTVLLSTHIFSLVEKVCDRVGVVIDGRMAACGTLAEVAGGRSLEDAFFDLYAACAKEA